MYTESAEYQYMKMLTTPKAWFKANIDATLQIYGRDHNIQKEDLLLGMLYMSIIGSVLCVFFFKKLSQVIGALQVQNYALFVSHKHPDGHVSLLRTIYCFFVLLILLFRFHLSFIGSFQCLFGSKERTSVGNVHN